MRSFAPLCFICVLLLAAPVFAVAAPSIYSGEAPVASQSDQDRVGALRAAFAGVLARQAGDPAIVGEDAVAEAVAQAERYVVQYQYRGNPPGAEAPLTLVASFDAAAVDALLERVDPGMAGAAPDAPSDVTLWIVGIRDADDFMRVMHYLTRSNFVRDVEPLQAAGDGMRVRLALATGLVRFSEAVDLERVLQPGPDAAAPAGDADAVFSLVH